MDIYAGSGICLEKTIQESSIVFQLVLSEGSTLTRNLIIFGQGLNKSHPTFKVLETILTMTYNFK